MHSRRARGTGAILGAVAWLATGWFFVAQVIVAWPWRTPYRLRDNYLSDLGAVHCGQSTGAARIVCSPWHPVMNASFVACGVLVVVGAVLLRRALPTGRAGLGGLALVGLAGAGLVVVGLFPEDVANTTHSVGAAVQFVAGALGLLVLGGTMRRWRAWGRFTVTCGTVALLGTVLFARHHYLGIGAGGMERVAVYPLFVWLPATGIHLLLRTSRPRGN